MRWNQSVLRFDGLGKNRKDASKQRVRAKRVTQRALLQEMERNCDSRTRSLLQLPRKRLVREENNGTFVTAARDKIHFTAIRADDP
jgi:hypothetical protein